MKVSCALYFVIGLTVITYGWTPAWTQDPPKDKNIRIVVPYAPGGGWDTYARVVARHIGKHIAGGPSVVVQNMPGAGGLLSINHIYNRASRDGLTMGMFETAVVFAQLGKDPAVKFDVAHFNWVGAFSGLTSTCIAAADSPFKSIKDVIASKEPMIVGSGGRVGGTNMEPLLLNRILGTRFQVIPGYRGTSEMQVAMMRGELHGFCGWDWTSIKATGRDLLENRRIHLLVQFVDRPHPEIPKDVPLITEITPEAKKPLLNTYLAPRMIGKNLMLPPKVPENRVQMLRRAFDKTMQDPEFLADAKRAELEIEPLKGEEITDRFQQLLRGATPQVLEELKKIMDSN